MRASCVLENVGKSDFEVAGVNARLIGIRVMNWVRVILVSVSCCFPLRSKAGEKLAFFSKSDRGPAPAMRVIRANCLACHSDEKMKGELRLTTRENLLKGGDDGPVLAPGKASESLLMRVVLPDSDPHMPPKKQLSEKDMATLRQWISDGAKWDAKALVEPLVPGKPVQLGAMPASYQPVLALALSPDEKRLAVGRANQIYLHDLTQTNRPIVAQLDAQGDAVQSLAWSADGRWLVSGGFRRVTLWKMDSSRYELGDQTNRLTTHPGPLPFEGRGRTDGREERGDVSGTLPYGRGSVLVTNDLVGRITALEFTTDGAKLVAADGRPTQSGIVHLISVADGRCEATWQAHGDSIYALRLSPDGKLLATGGADKLVKLWDLETRKEVAKLEAHMGHVLALAFNKDGSLLASGGADKVLNIWDVKTRKQEITINKHPAPILGLSWTPDGKSLFSICEDGSPHLFTDFKIHSGAESSDGARERTFGGAGELLYSLAAAANGKTVFSGAHDGNVYAWNGEGNLQGKLVAPVAEVEQPKVGKTKWGGQSAEDKVDRAKPLSFINDVLPVLSKAGCNAGSCHAKPDGQNGFKLSVFAFDPRSDYRHIVKADRGRRIFPACPEESLILQKPTLGIEHEGGQRFEVGSEFYKTILAWIKQGMPFSQTNEPALVEIKVDPSERRYHRGAAQPLRVEARYSDGRMRDVTGLADYVSYDKDVAKVDERGVVKVGTLRGEGVIIARYMGLVAISRITVPVDKVLPDSLYASLGAPPLDRASSPQPSPPSNGGEGEQTRESRASASGRAFPRTDDQTNRLTPHPSPLPVEGRGRNPGIDELVRARLKSLGLAPSQGCTDSEFLRRASLDTIGTLPTPEQAREFLADTSPGKRSRLIDRLLEHPAYADHWAVKWGDLLRGNPSRVGVKPVYMLDLWLR